METLGTAKDKQREDTTCSGKAQKGNAREGRCVERLSKGKAKLCNTLISKGMDERRTEEQRQSFVQRGKARAKQTHY